MRRLVLLGGGHAHVFVLEAMARRPWRGVEVLLVTPHERQMYSGMVPGVVAGHYRPEEAAIPLAPLAHAAGVEVRWASALALDATARQVRLSDGSTVDYDLLSIDTGAVMDRDAIPGARDHALFVRPIEAFVDTLPTLTARSSSTDPARKPSTVTSPQDGDPPRHIAVVGGGAAGFELALALAHAHGPRVGVTLVTGGSPLLAGYPMSVMARGARAARRLGVQVCQAAVASVAARSLTLTDGRELPCDRVLIAIGVSAAPGWQASGLRLDGRGFIATGATLQSLSHPEVFAAGDVATRLDVNHPRSGVYAVRAGPPLARNLLRMLQDRPPLPYVPQARTLNLLSCGGREAIATWGPWSAEGAWVWQWKDRIDRAFIQRFSRG